MTKSIRKEEGWTVRKVNSFFEHVGTFVSAYPWTCILLSTLLTIGLSIKIPLTEMENNISDFTPYEARSRKELEIYKSFFQNRGEPKTIYAFCSGKNGTNMLGLQQLNETVQVLDGISRDFRLKKNSKMETFEEFCSGFCTLNEPVRHFYSGMQIWDQYGNESRHLDLGYPVTTVLGTKLYMDPNFFGVKISIEDANNGIRRVVSVADGSAISSIQTQVPNNIRELDLIVLQFRAEIGNDVNADDLKVYEREIVDYYHKTFKSDVIDVYILTDSFITSEIVTAGLTLLPFLVIGFTIMSVFSSVTFIIGGIMNDQLNKFKIVLAIMACVAPFMACGTTLGGMFLSGFRFGSILCVTPFLVLAIGVDDAYLMVNAWQRITNERRTVAYTNVRQEVKHRIIEMLVETGPSVSITTITNVLAFGIGAMTPTPEIQLFSIGNALAVIVDFIYQLTIYAALMAIVGRYEIEKEMEKKEKQMKTLDLTEKSEKSDLSIHMTKPCKSKFLNFYCDTILNKYVSSAILGLLAAYWYISVVGTLQIKAELSPDKLFLQGSNIVKIFEQRKQHIIPYYGVCWVLVGAPGDITRETQKLRLHQLIESFEALPGSVGRYSTKFWMRDYEEFLRQSELMEEEEFEDLEEHDQLAHNRTFEEISLAFAENGTSSLKSFEDKVVMRNELKQFLEWPEFSFWKGFIQYKEKDDNTYDVTGFIITTAYHGHELQEWSNRAKLLNDWRNVADKFPDLNVSVYEDDAKFLDLIETMVPIASQSAFFTFVSMFIVAFLFISHPPTLFVATFSILSTSIGVFGMMSWWGADLDPILMSATVMSIGFSVDIPSHISYHFHLTRKETSCIRRRLESTIAAVGFPIMQASVSTTLCVLSLFFVDLHMSQLFAKCMLLVVVIGMIHGLVVIPVMFNLMSALPRKVSYAVSSQQHRAISVEVNFP
ncbi:unnamed protein product [Auanema sp. JU1783]|nr:unnamed protein product [Auanema sp. JU1783]